MIGAFLVFRRRHAQAVLVWLMCAADRHGRVARGHTRRLDRIGGGGLYLVWFWRRWMTLLVPAAILVVFLVSPPVIRERFTSIVRPQQVDSISSAWLPGAPASV